MGVPRAGLRKRCRRGPLPARGACQGPATSGGPVGLLPSPKRAGSEPRVRPEVAGPMTGSASRWGSAAVRLTQACRRGPPPYPPPFRGRVLVCRALPVARISAIASRASCRRARSFVAGVTLNPVPAHADVAKRRRRAAATDRRSSPAFCRRSSSRCASNCESTRDAAVHVLAVGVQIDALTAASAPRAPRSPPSAPCDCWWCRLRRP